MNKPLHGTIRMSSKDATNALYKLTGTVDAASQRLMTGMSWRDEQQTLEWRAIELTPEMRVIVDKDNYPIRDIYAEVEWGPDYD